MKPIPTAIPRTATQLPNGIASSSARVGLSTDVQGADPQALEKFNEALPKSRGTAKKPAGRKLPWEDEIMAAREEVLADAQEWQMAQAEVTGAGGSVGGAAGGAAGAAEAGGAAGAAGAGGAGGAAGAAAAAAGVSPLAFAPALALGGGGGGTFINTPPVLTLPAEARLAVNGTGDVPCAKASATDGDGQALSYSFWRDGQPTQSVKAYSKAANGQGPLLGYFSIDADSGQISFQYAEGANEALMCDEATLTVVAFDGIAYSAPGYITIEWAFDVDDSGVKSLEEVHEYGTPGQEGVPDLSCLLEDLKREVVEHVAEAFEDECGLDSVYAKSLVLTSMKPLDLRHSGSQLIHAALEPEDSNDKVSMLGFKARRDGEDLTMGWAHLVKSGSEDSSQLDAYLAEVTLSGYSASWNEIDGFVYVHFEKPINTPDYVHPGSFFATYDLGQEGVVDDPYVASCADVQVFPVQEHGVYRVSKSEAGTECNDLIAGAIDKHETLVGGAGNDIIFANGSSSYDSCVTSYGDSIIGGSGDDLIVLSGKGHTVRFESNYTSNGRDVVLGFEKGSYVELQGGGWETDVDAAEFDDFVFSQSGDDVLLTRWNGGEEKVEMAVFVQAKIEWFTNTSVAVLQA